MAQRGGVTERLIDLALEEDVGLGDVTTTSCVAADALGTGELVAKEPLVVSGLDLFTRVFHRVDPEVVVEAVAQDGDRVEPSAVVARTRGSLGAMLTAERVALNFIRHLSGVATLTRRMRDAMAAHPHVQLLDTRKTTPGMRVLEKSAVQAGGGVSHRFGLFDGVLIKDNHIVAAGSVQAAISRARAHAHHLLRIECEVTDLNELDQALDAGVDALLLDNMDDAALTEAVARARARAPEVFLEASGNMTEQRLAAVAACGVDAISVGALTHSAAAADLSLDLTAMVS